MVCNTAVYHGWIFFFVYSQMFIVEVLCIICIVAEFIKSLVRGQEQWAQCDDCSKWRKLPEDALLPPKWTCSENVWDSSRFFFYSYIQYDFVVFHVFYFVVYNLLLGVHVLHQRRWVQRIWIIFWDWAKVRFNLCAFHLQIGAKLLTNCHAFGMWIKHKVILDLCCYD